MNKNAEVALKKIQEIVDEMKVTKASNYSQYCDRLRTHIFANWRDNLDKLLTNLKAGLAEEEKQRLEEKKAVVEKAKAEEVSKKSQKNVAVAP